MNFAKGLERRIGSRMIKVKEILENIAVGAIGNRVNAAAIAGATALAMYGHPDLAVLIGWGISSLTSHGGETVRAFRATCKHIEKHGKLELRFVELYGLIGGGVKPYCVEQGIYLAARKYGQTKIFREVDGYIPPVRLSNLKEDNLWYTLAHLITKVPVI